MSSPPSAGDAFLEGTRPGPRTRCLLLFLIAGAALALRSADLTLPFTGRNDSEGTFNANAARNLLRHGYGACRVAILPKSGVWSPGDSPLYLHHPMLSTVLLTEVYRWTGVGEWAARLIWIVLSLATVVLTYRAVSLAAGPASGWMAAALLAFLPIDVHVGKLVSWRSLVLLFAVAQMISYALWVRDGKAKHFWGVVAFQALLCQSAWPGYFPGLFLPLSHWIWRRPNGRRMFVLPLVCVLSFAIFLLHNVWAGGMDNLVEALRGRLAGGEHATHTGGSFSLVAYASVLLRRLATRFGPPILLLALLGFLALRKRPGRTLLGQCLFVWLMLAVPQYVIFAPYSFIHEDDVCYLIPFVIGSAAPAAAAILESPGHAGRKLASLLLLLLVGHGVLGVYLSHRSTSQRMGYHLEYGWSLAVRDVTPFEDSTATDLKLSEAFYNFYVDRRVHAPVPSFAELDRLRREDPRLRWFVTTTPERLKRRYPYYRAVVDPSYFPSVGMREEDDPFLRSLHERYPSEERDGFLFFKMGPP